MAGSTAAHRRRERLPGTLCKRTLPAHPASRIPILWTHTLSLFRTVWTGLRGSAGTVGHAGAYRTRSPCARGPWRYVLTPCLPGILRKYCCLTRAERNCRKGLCMAYTWWAWHGMRHVSDQQNLRVGGRWNISGVSPKLSGACQGEGSYCTGPAIVAFLVIEATRGAGHAGFSPRCTPRLPFRTQTASLYHNAKALWNDALGTAFGRDLTTIRPLYH
jgi:hypothetical protein